MQAFLLGLSNGAVCLAYCAPVLIPYLLGEGKRISRNFAVLIRFLAGRLLGYLLFGIMAWAISRPVLQVVGHQELIIGFAYMLLSILLVFYGLFEARPLCAASRVTTLLRTVGDTSPFLIPVVAGIATGLNFCPPFLLALASTAGKSSLAHSLFFFLAFFLGTSIFFIPAPFVGLLRAFPVLRTVGKMAAGIMGIYYFYSGIIMVVGGIKSI
jgi:sulfite exporter TauE/SafE